MIFLAQDPETLRVDSPVDAADPRFPDYVASLVGAPVERGDAYTVLHNGDETFPAMLAAIDGAKSRISFETYVYKDGQIGDRFVEALAAAAKRGVVVRAVLDPIGSLMKPDNRDRLEQAGAKLSWFNPIRVTTIDVANYRTHRKTLVVDGRVAFTGGMGVADHWLGNAQDQDHWRDTHFKITGPAVRALEASFYENWIESGGRSAPALDPEMPPHATAARSIVLWSNPMSGASNVKLLYLLAISAARQSIDIANPYFVPDHVSIDLFRDAVKRGVRVRVMVAGVRNDTYITRLNSVRLYGALLDAGVAIYEYDRTMMHHKIMIVDGLWSTIGTANFDNRSFSHNEESNVCLCDERFADELTQTFEADITVCQRVTKEGWRRRSIFEKTLEAFASFVQDQV